MGHRILWAEQPAVVQAGSIAAQMPSLSLINVAQTFRPLKDCKWPGFRHSCANDPIVAQVFEREFQTERISPWIAPWSVVEGGRIRE